LKTRATELLLETVFSMWTMLGDLVTLASLVI